MNTFTKTAAAAATATAALLALSMPAAAFPVTQQSSNVHGSYGHTNASGGDLSGTVSAGAFALNAAEFGGDFAAWCLDLAHNLGLPSDYEITTTPFVDSPIASAALEALQKLVNTAYATLNLNSNAQSAGFQLALWEIINETGSSYDVNSGDFRVGSGTSSAARNFANGLLGNLDGAATGNYRLTYLQSTDEKQSLVTVSPVPVPAAGLMLIGALGGLGMVARRRKSKTA